MEIIEKLLPKEKHLNEHFFEKGFEIANDVPFETYYNQKFRKDE